MMINVHMWSYTLNYVQLLVIVMINEYMCLSTYIKGTHPLWGVYPVSNLLGLKYTKLNKVFHHHHPSFLVNCSGSQSNEW